MTSEVATTYAVAVGPLVVAIAFWLIHLMGLRLIKRIDNSPKYDRSLKDELPKWFVVATVLLLISVPAFYYCYCFIVIPHLYPSTR